MARFHGERIVVGARAEAFTPVPAHAGGDLLHGRVRRVEQHGQDWLARLDIGATAVAVPGAPAPGPADDAGGLRRLVNRLTGRGAPHLLPVAPVAARAGGPGHAPPVGDPDRGVPGADGNGARHAPAELAVRLPTYPRVAAGQPVSVRVRIAALHLFDAQGQRIDAVWRD